MGTDAACVEVYKRVRRLSVINQLLKHPLTEQGLAKFIEDSKKVPAATK